MLKYDTVIYNALIADGTGTELRAGGIAWKGAKILKVGDVDPNSAEVAIDARGQVIAPGFIDVHTHDDINVIQQPEMLPKISQGVTTVIVGNCGISASPVTLNTNSLHEQPPDPMHLLGDQATFQFDSFDSYAHAVQSARPNVNVAALVGHISLRNNVMADLSKAASADEIQHMRAQLQSALEQGAMGLSTGLAYQNAIGAPQSEVSALAQMLAQFDAVYTTHLRSEAEQIMQALDEAFSTAGEHKLRLVISHIKCAGRGNWHNSEAVLTKIIGQSDSQEIACDCYPYTASSSSLDLKQVNAETDIFITWSRSSPEVAGRYLSDIAATWQTSLLSAAERLQPAGAIYHCMHEDDVARFLSYSKTMIGSDGIPTDPHPHPRLWGTFARVLGHYVRDKQLITLPAAIHRMTGLPARQFQLSNRGQLKPGFCADVVLLDADSVRDCATYTQPTLPSKGIEAVWVNGTLSYKTGHHIATDVIGRAGKMLKHQFNKKERYNDSALWG